MNYVTTNIRIPEADYLKLKEEAARKRKSLAAVIREKITEPEAEKEFKPTGTLALLKIAEMAEKNKWSGPKDLAKNHNKYFVKAWESLKNKSSK